MTVRVVAAWPQLHRREPARAAGGEVPVDLALVSVGGVLPGGEFVVEEVEVAGAPVAALAGQGGEFDVGDAEP